MLIEAIDKMRPVRWTVLWATLGNGYSDGVSSDERFPLHTAISAAEKLAIDWNRIVRLRRPLRGRCVPFYRGSWKADGKRKWNTRCSLNFPVGKTESKIRQLHLIFEINCLATPRSLWKTYFRGVFLSNNRRVTKWYALDTHTQHTFETFNS